MIGRLLSLRLRAAFAAAGSRDKNGKQKKKSGGTVAFVVLVYIRLALLFGGLSMTVALFLCPTTMALGMEWLYFGVYMAVPFLLVFFLSVFETKSVLFEGKDNALLLSLPIRPEDIVISRIFVVLIYNYAEAAVVMVPFIAVYSVFGGHALTVVFAILAFLLLPLLATSFSAGVGYLVARISAKMKHKKAVQVILSMAFFFAYMYFYMTFLGSSGSDDMTGEEMEAVIRSLGETLRPLRYLGEAAMGTLFPTLVFVVVTLLVSYVVYRRISDPYVRLATAESSGPRVVYKQKKLEKRTSFLALCQKEFRRFISSPTYILNGATGIMLNVIAAIFMVLNRTTVAEMMAELGLPVSTAVPFLAAGLIALSCTNCLSASAVSLEGKELWIVRSLPLPPKEILLAKAVPHAVIVTGATLLPEIVLFAVYGAGVPEIVTAVLCLLSSCVFCALFGVVINTALPKFSFTNEAQVVKQSAAVFVAMLVQFIAGLIVIGLTVLFSFFSLAPVGLLLGAVLFLLGIVLCYVILCRSSARKFSTF